MVGGLVADKVRRLDTVAAFGFTVAAALLVLAAVVEMNRVPMVGIFGLAGFMLGIIAPSRDLLVRAVTPPGASGKTFGFVSVGLDVGSAGAPLLFGWILDMGAPKGVFLTAAALMMLALITAVAANKARVGA